jgi:cellulose synthase/poly-beta-1,6-N-acetylglucosamine synthase-like glycosyltransferase
MLRRCLTALIAQTLPAHEYEIIVCDDGPGDDVRAVVTEIAGQTSGAPALRYFPVESSQGPAGARNVGWRSAGAPVVAFTDDDTVPEPGWLAAGVFAMEQEGADAAAGRIVMLLPDAPSDVELDAAQLQHAEFATANCFVRRAALARVGGFDERYALAWREDSDLHFALLDHGSTVIAVPSAVVAHPLRPFPFAAGLGMQRKVAYDVLLYRKYPGFYRDRIRRGPPWFYLLVSFSLLCALVLFTAGRVHLAGLALLVWITLTLFFFIRRLSRSAFTGRNIAELLITSLLIPPLSIFWRGVGMARFGWSTP